MTLSGRGSHQFEQVDTSSMDPGCSVGLLEFEPRRRAYLETDTLIVYGSPSDEEGSEKPK